MKLTELLKDIPCRAPQSDAEVLSLCYDSRKAKAGTLFFCLSGAAVDGHSFAASAYENGCRLFAVERRLPLPDDALQVEFENTRAALALVSAAFYGHPAKRMRLVGITGTKGKTTVAHMIASCLEKAGVPCGYIGTSGISYAGKHFPTKNTTPESLELHRTFREMLESGVTTCALEVSSQALFNYRVDGIRFAVGIFTNLSPDHIGPTEHPDFTHYKNCKKKLFSLCDVGVFCADDPYAPDMREGSPCRAITYGVKSDADFRGTGITRMREGDRLGVRFTCRKADGDLALSLPVPGEFSALNALAAVATVKTFGLSDGVIAESLSQVSVPGRFEIVPVLPGRTFVIDYAHNEVSMRTLLETVREYAPKRIVCLFGSVGDRTKNRRRELASVALRLADFCILTSDNPGFEDPEAILDEIAAWAPPSACPYVKIANRDAAVRYAVTHSLPGDVVLLCGKGHEDYQLIGKERVPFSERAILLELAKQP